MYVIGKTDLPMMMEVMLYLHHDYITNWMSSNIQPEFTLTT